MEGLLASFPALNDAIYVEEIAGTRPRRAAIDLVGEPNQSLPVLIFVDDAPDGTANGNWNGRRFVDGKDAILAALTLCHGVPLPHP